MAKRSSFQFGQKPVIYRSRSLFDMSHSHKTMFNVGQLIPFYVQEVYPGDTFKVKSTNVIRTTAPFLRPVMDNIFLDMMYFFCPNRLVMDDWPVVMGENKTGYWVNQEQVTVPTIKGNVAVGSIADYMGLPINDYSNSATGVNVLPFRAFALIYNDWYRDENVEEPVLINKGSTETGSFNDQSWSVSNIFGMPPKVNKLHDYFTSCLPAPQKANAVDIPLPTFAPVYPRNDMNMDTFFSNGYSSGANNDFLRWQALDSSGAPQSMSRNLVRLPGFGFSDQEGESMAYFGAPFQSTTSQNVNPNLGLAPYNLVADFSSSFAGLSVNDLRFAFQLQKMYEKDARGGTRYVEYIEEHFNTKAGDYRLGRTEFLGGKRMPIRVEQIAQTSQSTENAPLAQVGAYSLSSGVCGMNKGFVEHGFIIGVMCVRQFHTYQQGVERFWSRTVRTDYYDPVFSNIGEQPVYSSEIFSSNDSMFDKTSVFGYNEAWADLRYRPSRISGALRSTASEGFDIWHFADYYGSKPLLNSEFMEEIPSYVDRTLSVPSTTAPNFVIDIFNDVKAIRPLPTYSIPGLIDHH